MDEPGVVVVLNRSVCRMEDRVCAILRAISDGQGKGLGAIKKATAPFWPEGAASQQDMMAYEFLRCLHLEGKVRFENVPVAGVLEGTTVPSRRAFLVRPETA